MLDRYTIEALIYLRMQGEIKFRLHSAKLDFARVGESLILHTLEELVPPRENRNWGYSKILFIQNHNLKSAVRIVGRYFLLNLSD